jgi:hypothetical protein
MLAAFQRFVSKGPNCNVWAAVVAYHTTGTTPAWDIDPYQSTWLTALREQVVSPIIRIKNFKNLKRS